MPGSQWSIGRAYNGFLKVVFDERGIEIPFPQVTYHVADDSEQEDVPQGEQKAAPRNRVFPKDGAGQAKTCRRMKALLDVS